MAPFRAIFYLFSTKLYTFVHFHWDHVLQGRNPDLCDFRMSRDFRPKTLCQVVQRQRVVTHCWLRECRFSPLLSFSRVRLTLLPLSLSTSHTACGSTFSVYVLTSCFTLYYAPLKWTTLCLPQWWFRTQTRQIYEAILASPNLCWRLATYSGWYPHPEAWSSQ